METALVTGVMERVGDCALNAFRQRLLNLLGNDRGLTSALGVTDFCLRSVLGATSVVDLVPISLSLGYETLGAVY